MWFVQVELPYVQLFFSHQNQFLESTKKCKFLIAALKQLQITFLFLFLLILAATVNKNNDCEIINFVLMPYL